MKKFEMLLSGQDEHDRMKSNINRVVQTLSGWLRWEGSDFKDLSFEYPSAVWTVNKVLGQKPTISCAVKVDGSFLTAYDGKEFTRAEHAQEVHESLDILLEGVMGRFPWIERKLEPYFKAAKN